MKTVKILGGAFYAKEAFLNPEPEKDYWWLNDMWKLDFYEPELITRWFEMHTFLRMRRRWNFEKIRWLKDTEKPFPIYMRRQYRRVKNSVRYPLREVASLAPGVPLRTLFGCSHSMMLGLAILEGYDRIELYGVNLSTPVEAYLERPSLAFWYGQAIARGIEVDTTHSPQLMPEVLYGFRDRLHEMKNTIFSVPQSVYVQMHGIEMYNDAMDPHLYEDK